MASHLRLKPSTEYVHDLWGMYGNCLERECNNFRLMWTGADLLTNLLAEYR